MNQGVRFILAVVAMIAVVLLTNIIFPPIPRAPNRTAADSTVTTVDTSARATGTVPAPARPQVPAPLTPPSSAAPEQVVIVESPLYRLGFSTHGAALVSAELLRFQSFTRDGKVQLAGRTPGGLVNHTFRINKDIIDLKQLTFTPSATRVVLNDSSAPAVLRFTSNTPQYGTVIIEYSLRPDDYLIDVHVAPQGGPAFEALHANIGPTLAINEARREEDERALAYVVNSQERGVERMLLHNLKADRIEEGPLDWVALKNKYFVVAAVVDTVSDARPFGGLIANDTSVRYAANLTAALPPNNNRAFSYRLYVGPQEHDRLSAVGNRLQDVNPVGWRVFRPILRPLADAILWALVTMHRAFGMSYGWVLIAFGILIRLAMWPLNAKAMRSQLKSMELQPRLKDIQTRYKNEPQKLQQEMMRLYKEEGFNPMGGCLPMLIPMPVLITLFFVFQSTIEFRGVSFLWLPDLSRADPLYILPIVLGLTMFAQQLISMKTMPPNPQMKFMMYFMPLFMVIIFFNLASGLNLYYAAQNLPGFIQQMQLTKERVRYQKERGLLPTPAPAPATAPAAQPRKSASRRKR